MAKFDPLTDIRTFNASISQTLLRCHLCPEVQGTFLAVKAHIKTNHGGQPLQFECNERGLQTKGPSLLQRHQIKAHIADITKTTELGSAGAAIPTATDGKDMTGQTERFKKNMPHEGPVAGPGPSPAMTIARQLKATKRPRQRCKKSAG